MRRRANANKTLSERERRQRRDARMKSMTLSEQHDCRRMRYTRLMPLTRRTKTTDSTFTRSFVQRLFVFVIGCVTIASADSTRFPSPCRSSCTPPPPPLHHSHLHIEQRRNQMMNRHSIRLHLHPRHSQHTFISCNNVSHTSFTRTMCTHSHSNNYILLHTRAIRLRFIRC